MWQYVDLFCTMQKTEVIAVDCLKKSASRPTLSDYLAARRYCGDVWTRDVLQCRLINKYVHETIVSTQYGGQ